MVVIILENVTEGFRGEITRWMLELKAGVFVGNISALVRQRLWEKIQNNPSEGSALMLYSAQNEQGFAIDMCRTPYRRVREIEGLYLIERSVEKQNNISR